MNDELAERIRNYVTVYVRRYNELSPALTGVAGPAPLYAGPVSTVTVHPAADGILVFYLTREAAERCGLNRRGVAVFAEDKCHLSHLIQAMTFNLVKAPLDPAEPVREDFSNFMSASRLPPDLPQEELRWICIGPEMREALLADEHTEVMEMTIAPTTQYQAGVPVGTEPTRTHILSPAVSLSGGRPILQFDWLFADVLWQAADLALDGEMAAQLAEADLNALRLGIEASLPPRQLYQDPFGTVAAHCLDVCRQFEGLLDAPDIGEEEVQAFLEQPAPHFLVAPMGVEVHPRKPLGGGKYVPDFTVLRPDREYHFIRVVAR